MSRYDYSGGGPRYALRLGGAMTPAVKGLIIANTAVFVVEGLLRNILDMGALDEVFRGLFALQPSMVIGRFFIWQLATYLFLHGDLGHILMNMFMLWMFG